MLPAQSPDQEYSMFRTRICATAVLFLFAACGHDSPQVEPVSAAPAASVAKAAERIALESIIVDGHVDLPSRLAENPADVTIASDRGDFDLPRAVAGGLNAPFMSIYTDAELEAKGESYASANHLIDIVEDIVRKAPGQFAIALTVEDVREQFEAGLISLPMGMENGSPLESDMDKLDYFFDRGIRYITLVHGKWNSISDSSYDEDKHWQGLSEFGKSLIPEMNRLGIIVDISHVSDAAFYQALELSTVPVIASHSSARHFTPGFERNMSNDMIEKLAAKGGLIMINFGSSFITPRANEYMTARGEAGLAYKEAHPDVGTEFLYREFPAIYAAEQGPFPYATLDDVLDHFDHVVQLVGVEHVGIGSDYDGVGDSLPIGLKDVASYPNLIEGFLNRGYQEEDIRKILGENLLRVWTVVEDYAAQQ
jgi:membrane dipeptidase